MQDPIYWQGDPYRVDSEGEYVEQHHGGEPS